MKCAVVQDLLPIYCDGACSPETSAEIEKHTADCPVCSNLLNDYKSEIKPVDAEEMLPKKPFRKIKKKFFRNKLVIVMLAIILLTLISTVCYLGYGQVIKFYEHPSFETIISSMNARNFIRKLCDGDIDYVMKRVSILDEDIYYYDSHIMNKGVTENCREFFANYYNYVKGRKISIKSISRTYYNVTSNNLIEIASSFSVEADGLPVVWFSFFDEGGRYKIYCAVADRSLYNENDAFCNFIDKMNFALDPVSGKGQKFEKNAINAEIAPEQPEKNFAVRYAFLGGHYSDRETDNEAYSRSLLESWEKIHDAGIYCDDFDRMNFRFDKESKRFLVDVYAVFTDPDTQNKIVYVRTIQVRDYYRYVVLDEYEPTIIDSGVSPDTLEKIKNLF